MAGKIKYAKWKAADIIKAIREGRAPVPGPPGGEDSQAEGLDMPPHESEVPGTGGIDVTSNIPPTTGQDNIDSSQPFITQFPSPPSNFTAAIPPSSPNQDILPPPAGFIGSPNRPPSPPLTGSNSFSQPTQATNIGDVNLPPHNLSSVPPPGVSPVLPRVTRTPPQPARTEYSPAVPSQHLPGPGEIAQAQKHAKFAISALTYDDIKTARENLLKALDTIGYNQSNNFGF